MNLKRITPPGALPVTLEEAKAHCVVDFDNDDGILGGYIAAAVDYLDGRHGVLGRCLIDQTWSVQFANWAPDFALPFPDCKSVAITYSDAAEVEQTVAVADYEELQEAGRTVTQFAKGFGRPGLSDSKAFPITVEFTAGYGAAEDMPPGLKQAILTMVSHWYEHRGSTVSRATVVDLPNGLEGLISSYRVISF